MVRRRFIQILMISPFGFYVGSYVKPILNSAFLHNNSLLKVIIKGSVHSYRKLYGLVGSIEPFFLATLPASIRADMPSST